MKFHICSFSDPADYKIRFDGGEYRFEWSDRFGPLFIGKTGKILRNQNPPGKVIDAITKWEKQGKRICPNGYCIWRPEDSGVFHFLAPRVAVWTRGVVLQNDRCA